LLCPLLHIVDRANLTELQLKRLMKSGRDWNPAMHKGPKRRSASFLMGVPLWWAVQGTFGWPFLVRGSSNPVWPATSRLEPWCGGILISHKVPVMNIRSLTVREGHRDYSLKSAPHNGNPKIPLILLKGTWLEESGFVIGLPVCVKVSQNQIIITPR